MPAIARLGAVSLDAPDPIALGRFYQEILGLEVQRETPALVLLKGAPVLIAIHQVADLPPWAAPIGPPLLSQDGHRARAGADHAQQSADGGCLSCPVQAEKAVNFPLDDAQVHRIHGANCTVGFGKLVGFNDGMDAAPVASAATVQCWLVIAAINKVISQSVIFHRIICSRAGYKPWQPEIRKRPGRPAACRPRC